MSFVSNGFRFIAQASGQMGMRTAISSRMGIEKVHLLQQRHFSVYAKLKELPGRIKNCFSWIKAHKWWFVGAVGLGTIVELSHFFYAYSELDYNRSCTDFDGKPFDI